MTQNTHRQTQTLHITKIKICPANIYTYPIRVSATDTHNSLRAAPAHCTLVVRGLDVGGGGGGDQIPSWCDALTGGAGAQCVVR